MKASTTKVDADVAFGSTLFGCKFSLTLDVSKNFCNKSVSQTSCFGVSSLEAAFFQNIVPFEAFAFNMIDPICSHHTQGKKQVTLCKKECLKFHNVFLSHNPKNEGKYSKSHCRCYFWDDTLSM